jgi:tRNA 2-thiouridine synthesizing protein B
MLYLVDKPMAELAFRTAAGDEAARVVLIQDGVFLDPDLELPTYAVREDVEVRGVDLPPGVEPVSYDRLIQMLLEHEVRSFV